MKNLYSICDKVIGEFAPPFVAPNDTHALRLFQSALKDVQFPNDYLLYHVGFYSFENGIVSGCEDGPHEVNTADVFQQILKAKEGK